ncbi:alpha/beta hydrolase [Noviherbaspirillum cavernae]|uniref:Alpha/beta hydrolase n=1 Tax=Noviherbaspirillum cavernae TaxID=2320862 RepID=A0A418WZM5_9BURK|nr:alpha/beta hydrolase [Noviherbaspirillum cavernae]RJG05707.1 alpha/beta hydrolase [Noviherbaspirillum cavernae]
MQFNIQGQQAYCYTGGKAFNPALPTAVFIHGVQNDHSVWALQTRYFAHHGFGVLALDLPSHGRSTGSPLQSVEAMAAWLFAVLDAAGVRQATLIGHSMGSLVALEAAFQNPDRVRKIAMVGTAYPMKVSDVLLDASKNDEQKAIDMVTIWSHSSIAQKPSFPGPGFYAMNGDLRLMQRIAQQHGERVFHTDFSACNAYANGEAAAQSVKCPVLFLLGKNDMMTMPRHAGTLVKAMPHAEMVQLDNCGHALMAEQPDAVLDTLFAFAKK